RVAPTRGLLVVDSELGGAFRVALGGVEGLAQVPLGHEVGVHVVVGDRAVLVGAGDTIDAEAPGSVVMPQRAPQPRRLDEQLEADGATELSVPARPLTG